LYEGSINTVRFREEYRQNLENFINMINDTTRHASSFLKFLFLRELNNPQYNFTLTITIRIFFTRIRISGILQNYYAVVLTNNDQNQFASYCKLKFLANLNKTGADQDLIARMNQKFPNATYIMSNYFIPNIRFHEPIQGVGFRR
jgi:hypothetical protein